MQWAPSELDHYSHAVTPQAEHPVGGLTAVCGHPLASGVPLYEDAPGLKCLQCVLHLLAPAAVCTCTGAQEAAGLRARLSEFIELAEAPGLWVSQWAELARQARRDLEGFRARQLAELAQRHAARALPGCPAAGRRGGRD